MARDFWIRINVCTYFLPVFWMLYFRRVSATLLHSFCFAGYRKSSMTTWESAFCLWVCIPRRRQKCKRNLCQRFPKHHENKCVYIRSALGYVVVRVGKGTNYLFTMLCVAIVSHFNFSWPESVISKERLFKRAWSPRNVIPSLSCTLFNSPIP